MQKYHNENLNLFKYNLLYKDWCLKHLVLSFDHIDDLVLLMRKRLHEILRIRIITIPTISELKHKIFNDYDELKTYINPDGIVFKSYSYSMNVEDLRFEHVAIFSYERKHKSSLRIIYNYKSISNKLYEFEIQPHISDLDYHTVTFNQSKLLVDFHEYGLTYHKNPTFIAY